MAEPRRLREYAISLFIQPSPMHTKPDYTLISIVDRRQIT